MYGYMSDAQQENISHLLDHVDEQMFNLTDMMETDMEDEKLAKEMLKLCDKISHLLEEVREQIY